MYHRILLFMLLVAVVVGCDEDNPINVPDLFEAQSVDSLTVPSTGIDSLIISNINGTIDVVPSDNDSIYVTITKICGSEQLEDAEQYLDSIIVEETNESGMLNYLVSLPNDTERTYTVDFEISVPPDFQLDLSTINGDINVDSLQRPVDITITNGNISIYDHNANVYGTIINGNIACNVDQLDSGEHVSLVTINGNVNITVPSLVSATFDCRASNGTATVSGFPNINYNFNEADRKGGFIGSGAADIAVRSNNGSVSMTGI